MVESSHPKIDVHELMERVRAEVVERRSGPILRPNGSDTAQTGPAAIPEIGWHTSSPPTLASRADKARTDQLARLHDLLERARKATEGRGQAIDGLRRLLNQGRYNSLLLQSVIVLFETLDKFVQWQEQLGADFQGQSRWLSDLADRLNTRFQQQAQDRSNLGKHLNNLQTQTNNACEHLHNLQEETDGVRNQVATHRTRFEEQANSATNLAKHVNNLQTQTDNACKHLGNLQAQADALRNEVAIHRTELERAKTRLAEQMGGIGTKADDAKETALRVDGRQSSDSAFLKSQLHLVHRHLLEMQPAHARSTQAAAKEALPVDQHELDALYVAFENQFRGSRDLIKNRVRVYLSDLQDLGLGKADSPILDLGCGRGEWLELLRENGFVAEGVDLNSIMISECRERNLPVIEADAIEHLRALPSESHGVVTAFHLIEHLEFRTLVDLLHESFRVLRPGGLVIFETPNPDNVLVGSNRFYSDPTHQHPLPKEFTCFMLRSVGFADVISRPLNPDSNSLPENSAAPELRAFLNQLFFGDQDYAAIGRRPAA